MIEVETRFGEAGSADLKYAPAVHNIAKNMTAQLAFHTKHGKRATVTAVHTTCRYGALDMDRKLARRLLSLQRQSAMPKTCAQSRWRRLLIANQESNTFNHATL
jgi:hypothetical protein